MATLLSYELIVPGSAHPFEELVVLGDDGEVTRSVPYPGGVESPEAGWWTGNLDAESLGTAAALAGEPWAFDEIRSSPPAAGAWYVSGAPGRIGLWSSVGDELPGDALRSRLSAILSACVDASSDRRCVVRFRAEWTALADGRHPTLYVAATGTQRVSLRIQDGPDVGPGAFMNDDFEVVGYTQSEMWVPSGTEVYGLLRDRQPSDRGLIVDALLADETGERLHIAATVDVEEAPAPIA